MVGATGSIPVPPTMLHNKTGNMSVRDEHPGVDDGIGHVDPLHAFVPTNRRGLQRRFVVVRREQRRQLRRAARGTGRVAGQVALAAAAPAAAGVGGVQTPRASGLIAFPDEIIAARAL